MHPLPRLIRPVNVIMAAVGVFVGAVAFADSFDLLFIFTAALIWAIATAASNMINDSFDARIDIINHPDRPIPMGQTTSEKVLLSGNLLYLPCIYLAFVLSPMLFLLVIISIFFEYAYELYFKRRGLMGNILVGVLVGTSFVAGGIVNDNLPVALTIGIMAAMANTGREIVKDIEDKAGDMGRASVVKIKGSGSAQALASFFFICPMFLAFMIYWPMGYGNVLFLAFISLACVGFIIAVINAVSNPKFSQRAAKIAMVTALAAFLAGSYI